MRHDDLSPDVAEQRLEAAWLDAALDEVLGGLTPASEDRPAGSRPATAVHNVTARRRLLVGAALLSIGVGALAFVWSQRRADDVPVLDAAATAPSRVLLISQHADWSYRYVANALSRDDRLHFAGCVLEVRDAAQREAAGLVGLPIENADWRAYDVILIADLSPSAVSDTGLDPDQFVRSLDDFVTAGGGLGFVCGGAAMPSEWHATKLVSLLPMTPSSASTRDEWIPTLTATGLSHPIFASTDANEHHLFADSRTLPATHHYAGIANPDCRVLVADRDDPTVPLVVLSPSGPRRLAAIAHAELWRLRNGAAPAHDSFWQNLSRWLGGGLADD